MNIIDSVHNYINIFDEEGLKSSLDLKYEEEIQKEKMLKSDIVTMGTSDTLNRNTNKITSISFKTLKDSSNIPNFNP